MGSCCYSPLLTCLPGMHVYIYILLLLLSSSLLLFSLLLVLLDIISIIIIIDYTVYIFLLYYIIISHLLLLMCKFNHVNPQFFGIFFHSHFRVPRLFSRRLELPKDWAMVGALQRWYLGDRQRSSPWLFRCEKSWVWLDYLGVPHSTPPF